MKKVVVSLLVLFIALGAMFAAASSEKAATPVAKDSLVIGDNVTYTTLSPFVQYATTGSATYALYEKLAYVENGVLVPELAYEWTTEDNTTYTIKIYDYIYDSEGNHITANDVVYSYNMTIANGITNYVADIKAIDDYTVQMTLTDPAIGNFETNIGLVNIVSQAAYEKSGDGMATQPISSSIYNVVDFVAGSYVTLTKNENYWQKDASKLSTLQTGKYKTIKFLSVSEPSQQTIALETGTVDVIESIDKTQVANFLEGGEYSGKFSVVSAVGGTATSLFFSGSSEIIGQDKNLRLAIMYAIDRVGFTKVSSQGVATACEMFGNINAGDAVTYYQKEGGYSPYNVELAKEYLAKSNYKGETLRFLSTTAFETQSLVIQDYLKKIGINVEINAPDLAVYQKTYKDPTAFDFALCANTVNYNSTFWYKQYFNAKGTTRHGWTDPELIEAANLANQPENHTAENVEKVSRLLDDRAYGMGLYIDSRFHVVSNAIQLPENPVILTLGGYFLPVWAY